jgi:hypothetical protein
LHWKVDPGGLAQVLAAQLRVQHSAPSVQGCPTSTH